MLFSVRMTTMRLTPPPIIRTTPRRLHFKEPCDYMAHHCFKAYITGAVCGRTLYFHYYTFKNYCMLEYVNCMERYRVWQLLHMGPCYEVKEHEEYLRYPYDDDYFLDQYYVIEDH
ncbi:uncharacterized protein LOC112057019 [Bicyclus anynana]|uniref:Uncharacterized protein LOC112057019 n=1 Tax=Bicyclus anynana TaxID=110368 RepID=A0ABM3M0N6_BICAN|nr:uncharacterized protein LOC112057019 [Bicyclus anynana]